MLEDKIVEVPVERVIERVIEEPEHVVVERVVEDVIEVFFCHRQIQ